MEKLYLDIMNHLSQIEEISTIAEDYGQLESGEDGYPITFPAILISTPNASWENYGGRAQTGRVTIEVKLAIDCYDDTQYSSTTEEDAENRINLYNRIHWLLQGFRPGTASGLIRTQSQFFSLPHGIKCYSGSYTCEVIDTIIPPLSTSKSVKLNLKME